MPDTHQKILIANEDISTRKALKFTLLEGQFDVVGEVIGKSVSDFIVPPLNQGKVLDARSQFN